MKILAIDYGTKNIGLALSDDRGKLAFVYKVLTPPVGRRVDVFDEIKKICEKEKVDKIIIGLPIGLSGKNTQTTELALDFIKKLKQELNISVQTVDERLSTVQAGYLESKNKKNINELSAQILLQDYLDKLYKPINLFQTCGFTSLD